MKQYCYNISSIVILILTMLPNYIFTHDIPSPSQTTQQQLSFIRRTIAKCMYLYQKYKKYHANQYTPEEKKQFEKELRLLRNKVLIIGSVFIIVPTTILYAHYFYKYGSVYMQRKEELKKIPIN